MKEMMSKSDPNKGPKDNKGQDVVSVVDEILKKAVSLSASDVHFEPTEDEFIIKYRLDGTLSVVERLPKALADNVISRLKVIGGLLTYRTDIPQEGRIDVEHGTKGVLDERLAIFPTINGQRAVVRIFYQHKELMELSQLGFSSSIFNTLKRIATKNQGILLFTGPAGSGKSTTLAALLRYILNNFPGRSIVTLEDPVEIRINGITQVQISPYGEMTFPTALRSLLRQDPQVLMIGEVRDAETARIVIEAGLTGHFLMSTMHSGTPSGAFLRLLEMGIEPYQVTSGITAVVNQRLVRRLCDSCKRKNEKTGFFDAVGCQKCFNTGYRGRALISELVEIDSALRKAILEKADIEKLQDVLKERNHRNILNDGLHLVEQGITTKQELHYVCGTFLED
jgi:general secretion pathway protein E